MTATSKPSKSELSKPKSSKSKPATKKAAASKKPAVRKNHSPKQAPNHSPKHLAKQGDVNNNTATTARQWYIITLLERGRWIGTHQILAQLQLAGFDISIRTIQRDLNALAERFPIETKKTNPQGWRWRDDAPMQSLPHMSLSQAVAFAMLEANLMQLLPPTILAELYPWFDLAQRQLKDSKVSHSWLDRVRIETATQPLIAPDIDTQCRERIYQALFHRHQIKVIYHRRQQHSEGKSYTLNPVAIVQRGWIIYLLATRTDDEQQTIRFFALHRFSAVEVTDTPASDPEGFDLDAFMASGGMGFSHPLFRALPDHGKDTAITLHLSPKAISTLSESRLSMDQTLDELEDGSYLVSATVHLTYQLVWWLRGFGSALLGATPAVLYQAVIDDVYAQTQAQTQA